jgi:hypothetical protein
MNVRHGRQKMVHIKKVNIWSRVIHVPKVDKKRLQEGRKENILNLKMRI